MAERIIAEEMTIITMITEDVGDDDDEDDEWWWLWFVRASFVAVVPPLL